MSPITTHVLDTAAGRPAAGIGVTLEFFAEGQQSWTKLGQAKTDSDGRIRDLLPENHALMAGFYRLRFDTVAVSAFFPQVSIQFRIIDRAQHYHVPLLLSPYGYSTYRGS
jgi:5-hydroxyisourate hydrolase